MSRADRRSIWGSAGAFVGSQCFLAFTLIAQPSHWLFVSWSTGRAAVAYGYIAMMVTALFAVAGYWAARLTETEGDQE